MTISYAIEDGFDPDEFVDVLKRSGLDERRPVDAPDGMEYYPRAGLEKFDNCFGLRRA